MSDVAVGCLEAHEEQHLAATAELFAAMAHGARLSMLLLLSRRGQASAGDLAQAAGLEQSAASHQLRVLKDARLIVGERDGRRIVYSLADKHVSHIVEDALAHAAEPG